MLAGTKISIVKKLLLNDSATPTWGQVFITRRCDLRCPFCAAPLHDADELSTEQWFRAIDILSSWGVKALNIVGGEPTLYKGLWDVLDYAKSRRLLTILHSNLRRPSPDLVDNAVRTGVYALEASLDSLDGSLPKSDQHVLEILREARGRGIKPIVCSVITDTNVSQIPEIARMVTDAGFVYLVALYQTVGGRFSTTNEVLVPKISDVRRIFSDLIKLKKETALIKNSFLYLENPQLHNGSKWHCDGNKDVWIAIDSDGTLMPCQEYRSTMSVFDLVEPQSKENWRNEKLSVTNSCGGCGYHCYIEAEELMGSKFLREISSYLVGSRKTSAFG